MILAVEAVRALLVITALELVSLRALVSHRQAYLSSCSHFVGLLIVGEPLVLE
jgi:hypothetical protein